MDLSGLFIAILLLLFMRLYTFKVVREEKNSRKDLMISVGFIFQGSKACATGFVTIKNKTPPVYMKCSPP